MILRLALAAALVFPGLAAAQAELPPSSRPLQSAELLRRGAGMTMLKSFLELGRFYLEHDRADRARQILTYGLLHDPGNADLLGAAASAEVRLGNFADALAFAEEANRIAPSAERAWQLTEIRRIQALRPAAATAPTTASTAPAVATTASAPATPAPTSGALTAKVRALHLAVALEGAIRGYNVGKKKKDRMSQLDVDKLKAEHFLPEEFDLSSFQVSAVTSDGKVTIEGLGTVAELHAIVGDYAKLSAESSRYLRDGAMAEATLRLQEMRAKFPDEPEVAGRLLYALRSQQRWAEALATVEEMLKTTPESVPLLYDRALLLLETGRVEEAVAQATALASRPGAGVHGVLARELTRIATAGASPELEQDIRSLSEGKSAASTSAASAPATTGSSR